MLPITEATQFWLIIVTTTTTTTNGTTQICKLFTDNSPVDFCYMSNGERKGTEGIICHDLSHVMSAICVQVCIKTTEESFP